MGKRVCKGDQLRLIRECRQSGLTDYRWCEQNGIHPGNFYSRMSNLRKQCYTFPESEAKSSAIPNVQGGVKVNLTPSPTPKLQTEPMHNMFRALRRVLDEHSDVKAIYPIRMKPVIWMAADEGLGDCDRIHIIEPIEAFILVMRDTTERLEGVEAGKLLDDEAEYEKMAHAANPYGDGHACERIADVLEGKEYGEWKV